MQEQFDSPQQSGGEQPHSSVQDLNDIALGRTSEIRRKVFDWHTEHYGHALLTLMERSGDSQELVNAMRDFVAQLEQRSYFGDASEPLSTSKQEDLIRFFRDGARRLGGDGHTGWYIAE